MTDQASRGIAVPAGSGRTVRVLDDVLTVKLGGDQTHHAFSLFFDRVLPGGGVPAHVQQGQETFILFEGELEFSIGDGTALSTFTAARGTVIHIPEGVAHAYRNASGERAAFFVIFTPAGASERFFERLGVPVLDPERPPAFGSPDPQGLLALLEEFGIRIVPPFSHKEG